MFLTSSHAAAAAAASLSFGNHCSKEHTVQTVTYGCLIFDFRYRVGGGLWKSGEGPILKKELRQCPGHPQGAGIKGHPAFSAVLILLGYKQPEIWIFL